MGFGQPSGPPASARQVSELLALLHEAGHAGFRDARGPMGFTQRQAEGRFTRAEADEAMAQLGPASAGAVSPPSRPRASLEATAASQRVVRRIPDALLAAELERRGWLVIAP